LWLKVGCGYTPKKYQKHRLQQYKVFGLAEGGTKVTFMAGIPTGFRTEMALPTPSGVPSLAA